MTAALLDFGLELEEAEQIQKNMSELFQEDSIKIEKLEGENIDMTKTEIDVTAAIKDLLKAGNEKKEDIETLAYKFSNLSRSMLINAYAKVKKEMGLTKETVSKELVDDYFEKNEIKLSGKEMVSGAMKKFNFTESTAKTYYSKWKKDYMLDKTSGDPLLVNKKDIEVLVPVETNKVEVVEMKGLKIIEEKTIKTIKVEGENGVYAADTTTGVVLSRDNMIIGFGSLKELETWVTEVKAVFAMVG